jgi:hypothetical protein
VRSRSAANGLVTAAARHGGPVFDERQRSPDHRTEHHEHWFA